MANHLQRTLRCKSPEEIELNINLGFHFYHPITIVHLKASSQLSLALVSEEKLLAPANSFSEITPQSQQWV